MFTSKRLQQIRKTAWRKSTGRPNRPRRLHAEALEDRTLLAVDMAPGPTDPPATTMDDQTAYVQPASAILGSDGTLRVFGTANDDDIKITDEFIQFEQWNPVGTPAIQVTIKDNNGQTLLSYAVTLPDYLLVSAIEVYAGDGDDTVENNTDIASVLFGGAGNDTLYGGFSDDVIWGEDGHDGLFGGGGGIDYIDPGPGDDRVLFSSSWNNYTGPWLDITGLNHTNINFGDSGPKSIDVDGYSQPATFEGGQWSINEIKMIDQAMKFVHHTQGNTKLLKRADGQKLNLIRVGYQDPHPSNTVTLAWNSNLGYIYLTNNLFTKGEDQILQTFLHEIGHNWDKENPQWETFKGFSGWTDVNPNNVNYAESHDGDWWYQTNSAFARDYGRTNPKEDFATAFAAYVTHEMGIPYQGTWKDGNNLIGWYNAPQKMAFIDSWLFGMSADFYNLIGSSLGSGGLSRSDSADDESSQRGGSDETVYRDSSADEPAAIEPNRTTADWQVESLSSETSTEDVSREVVDQALLEVLNEFETTR